MILAGCAGVLGLAAMWGVGRLPTSRISPPQIQDVASVSTENSTHEAKEISFDDAKKYPSLREAYVDRVVARLSVPKYIKSVRYSPGQPNHAGGSPDQKSMFNTGVSGDDLLLRSSGLESRIRVFDSAFLLGSEDEFLAGLTYHEFAHAKSFWEGFSFISGEKFYVDVRGKRTFFEGFHQVVTELDGISEQFYRSMGDGKAYSQRYIQEVLARWMESYRDLWRINQRYADTTPLKIRFFHEMMGNHPHQFERGSPNFSAKYSLVRVPSKRPDDYTDDEWRRANVPLPLPRGLDARIDSFYDEYLRNVTQIPWDNPLKDEKKLHWYNTPEFQMFVNRAMVLGRNR